MSAAAESFDYVVIGLGAFGSAAAYQLADRGHRVLGLEQFALGHSRGASHDTSRILRRSYHTAGYVRLAGEAYDDWAALSEAAGRPMVTPTGGLDLFPPDAAIEMNDYTASLDACGVPYSVFAPDEVADRWPRVRLPAGALALHQPDTGIVHAAETVATLQDLARSRGAALRADSPAQLVAAAGGVDVLTPQGRIECAAIVVAADAWTNDVLAPLGVRLPLTVTQEQVTYFVPDSTGDFTPGRFPVWIWMDEPSFYGFPTYGGAMVKAGQDVGGRITTAAERSFDPDPANLRQLSEFMSTTFPGSATRVDHTVTCLYTLTADRDFVLATLPDHPNVAVGLGAGHGFKFTPTFGRILADLATKGETGSDLSAFGVDRPAITDPDHPKSWLV